MNNNYITVTQLTKYIKYKIDNDSNLMKVFLKGEISNFKEHTRGHLYFTLKDENTRINAIMFESNAKKLLVMPKDGQKVLVTGRISVYEATGAYQIYVDTLEEDGLGNLFLQYEELKKKLDKEGLFDPVKKKPIPKYPNKIGIITAPTGAAIRDILSTIKRRWPLAETILFPSLVQGKDAAPDIVNNIEKTKKFDLDVLIVGRGGGSIEDMWCFNEEIVARAIYNLDTPVISAVGHEVDFTISDFVADLRAPTPTGAAEMAVPNLSDVLYNINQLETRTIKILEKEISVYKETLTKVLNSFVIKNPIVIYQVKEEKFASSLERLLNSYKNLIENNKSKLELIYERYKTSNKNNLVKKQNSLENAIAKLEVLNPLLTLKRGYAVVRSEKKIITKIKDVRSKDKLKIELSDGNINVEVL